MTRNADFVQPGKSAQMVTIRPDGSGLAGLTEFTGAKENAFAGSFSPDGKQIVFRYESGDNFSLAVMDSDGANLKRLTTGPGKPRFIDWEPTHELNGHPAGGSPHSTGRPPPTADRPAFAEGRRGDGRDRMQVERRARGGMVSAKTEKTTESQQRGWRRAVLAAIAVAAVGVAPAASTEAASQNTQAQMSPLAGRWQKVTTCRQMVDSLRRFGLETVAPGMLAGNGLVSGTPAELAAKEDVCEGAVPRVHSHFFTRRGRFGSLDWNREEVDGGTYQRVSATTLRIGQATFRYRIVNGGKHLLLTPVISQALKRQALAAPLEFSPAGWMVAVALPAGPAWKRVPCGRWC